MHPMIDRGAVIGHERGIVTSASLMVNGRSAATAAAAIRRLPRLSVGLHLDLGEWEHVDGEWRPVYEVVDMDDPAAVARELDAQIVRFAELCGRPPAHIDSHQHVHREGTVAEVVARAARRGGIPVRGTTLGARHLGGFYGQTGTGDPFPEGISLAGLIAAIRALRPGVSEMACHPAAGASVPPYSRERVEELRVLCHPAVRAAIAEEGVTLVTPRVLVA